MRLTVLCMPLLGSLVRVVIDAPYPFNTVAPALVRGLRNNSVPERTAYAQNPVHFDVPRAPT